MIITICLLLVVLGVLFLWVLKRQERSFGSLSQEKIYQDTEWSPGDVLSARSLPLRGKPDYLIRDGKTIIPVEIKTGKTPSSPYLNHSMQVIAYCYLVEDLYGIRPPGGIIKYPEKEYKVGYTEAAKTSLIALVEEMVAAKRSRREFHCQHPNHNL